jgi:thiol:disulfide interchange protein
MNQLVIEEPDKLKYSNGIEIMKHLDNNLECLSYVNIEQQSGCDVATLFNVNTEKSINLDETMSIFDVPANNSENCDIVSQKLLTTNKIDDVHIKINESKSEEYEITSKLKLCNKNKENKQPTKPRPYDKDKKDVKQESKVKQDDQKDEKEKESNNNNNKEEEEKVQTILHNNNGTNNADNTSNNADVDKEKGCDMKISILISANLRKQGKLTKPYRKEEDYGRTGSSLIGTLKKNENVK